MARDPRYDVLFDSLRLGPVTLKNRFYQVPHCNGLGSDLPYSHAAMRGVKAEGGWAAVCTEILSIHPSSDSTPFPQVKLWDADDERSLRLLTDAVHEHGALAGAELAHGGFAVANRYTREHILSPIEIPSRRDPIQARAMDKADIREYRRWHRARCAPRPARPGSTSSTCTRPTISSSCSISCQRDATIGRDEYGGSLENRTRLLREVIEDTKDAVGDTCAVAVRLTVDEIPARTAFWRRPKVATSWPCWPTCRTRGTSRSRAGRTDSADLALRQEGYQEPYTRYVKQVTTKPVIGIGRFTSPDTMVSQIRRGVLDLIGAARPSIADPFLPKKIEEGRLEDIRECIGCNICVSSDISRRADPLHAEPDHGRGMAQRGWHPERIAAGRASGAVLIVGAGPAGLEAAQRARPARLRGASRRGGRELGGRVDARSALAGPRASGRASATGGSARSPRCRTSRSISRAR